MNETIGVKGGKNDRRRRLKITKKQLEKLNIASKEQIKEEEKLKENQIKSIITVAPVIALGTVLQELTDIKLEKKEKQDSSSNKPVEVIEQNNISLPETTIDKK